MLNSNNHVQNDSVNCGPCICYIIERWLHHGKNVSNLEKEWDKDRRSFDASVYRNNLLDKVRKNVSPGADLMPPQFKGRLELETMTRKIGESSPFFTFSLTSLCSTEIQTGRFYRRTDHRYALEPHGGIRGCEEISRAHPDYCCEVSTSSLCL